jgi:hypothetical protein
MFANAPTDISRQIGVENQAAHRRRCADRRIVCASAGAMETISDGSTTSRTKMAQEITNLVICFAYSLWGISEGKRNLMTLAVLMCVRGRSRFSIRDGKVGRT